MKKNVLFKPTLFLVTLSPVFLSTISIASTFSAGAIWITSGNPNSSGVCALADSEMNGARWMGNTAGICFQGNGNKASRWVNNTITLISSQGTYYNAFQGIVAQYGSQLYLESAATTNNIDTKFKIYAGVPDTSNTYNYAIYADNVLSSNSDKKSTILINGKDYTPQVYLGKANDIGLYAGNQGVIKMNGAIITSYDTSATVLKSTTQGEITLTGLVRFIGRTSVDSAGTEQDSLGIININAQPSTYTADPVKNSTLVFTGDSSLTNLTAYNTSIYLSTPLESTKTDYTSQLASGLNDTTNNYYYTATEDATFTGNTLTLYGDYASTTANATAIDFDTEKSQFSGSGLNISNSSFTVNNNANSIVDYALTPDTTNYLTTVDKTTLYFQTVLGGDDSMTDKLIVQGNTSGDTDVVVTNVGGTGERTSKGIELIEVEGQSDGTFSLASRVVAGAYEYWLVKADENNASTFGYETDDYGNWYLVNNTGSNNGDTPIERPETGNYLSGNYLANTMFITRLWDRTGYSRHFYIKDDRYATQHGRKIYNKENNEINKYDNDVASYQCRYRTDLKEKIENGTQEEYVFIHRGNPIEIYKKPENKEEEKNPELLAAFPDCLDKDNDDKYSLKYAEHFEPTHGAWVHLIRNKGRLENNSGQVNTKTRSYILQTGIDIFSFSTNDINNYDIGVMASFGKGWSDSYSKLTGYSSQQKVRGWNWGIYATYYSDWLEKQGTYVDTWVTFNRFRHTVKGQNLVEETYRSKGITASIEIGHNYLLGQKDYTKDENRENGDLIRRDWFLQPQAQLVYLGVRSNEFNESSSNSKVKWGESSYLIRLGARTSLRYYKYTNPNKEGKPEFNYIVTEPYIEANWLHYTKDFSAVFNDTKVQSGTLRDLLELKTGIKREWIHKSYLWADVAAQFGKNRYRNYAFMLGYTYKF